MNGPHLDDENLSAALDDISSTAGDQAHLAGCSVCQARLGQLASIAEAIAAPVPPRPSDEVTAAIQQALASAPARSAPAAATGPAMIPSHRPPRRWLAVAGAAAAAAVLVATVGVLLIRGGSGKTGSIAAKAGPTSSQLAPAQAAIGGELGEQSDPKVLAGLLTARLTEGSAAASSGGAGSPAGIAPSPSGPLPGSQPVVPSTGPEPDSSCLLPAMRAAGQAGDHPGALRLVARLRWRGLPALVFVFDRQPPAAGRAGVVIATSGCTLLNRLPM
jgi:hypothetical protein